jgi:hypothetical protein
LAEIGAARQKAGRCGAAAHFQQAAAADGALHDALKVLVAAGVGGQIVGASVLGVHVMTANEAWERPFLRPVCDKKVNAM